MAFYTYNRLDIAKLGFQSIDQNFILLTSKTHMKVINFISFVFIEAKEKRDKICGDLYQEAKRFCMF